MVKAHFDNIRQNIIHELDKACEKIVVAVCWFTNQTLFEILMTKLSDGLKVELIIHNDYINNRDTGLNFQKFIDNGGEFYFSNTFNPMHNKFCVIDSKVLISGSYNWTYYAEDRNRENIVLIEEELETIDAFINEFERLKTLSFKQEKIRKITKFEVDEYNLLSARNYLANDIVLQAKDKGDKNIVESAFHLVPENIEVQKLAFNFKLTKRYKLKHSIGIKTSNDNYGVMVTKGTFLPVSITQILQTACDNQSVINSEIYYGESQVASANQKFAEIKTTGLPVKSVGEAKVKCHLKIDIFGNFIVEQFSLDNGNRQLVHAEIKALLEEELD